MESQSRDEDDGLKSQPHPIPNPFLNHLVIKNILSYSQSSVGDLKSLRLLCAQWNELTSPILSERSIVYVQSVRRMRQFLEDFSSNVNLLHKNYHIKLLQTLESPEAAGFLNFILGPRVRALELHLSKCVMRGREIGRLLQLGRESLRTLSLNEVLIDKEDEEEDETSTTTSKSILLTRLEVTSCANEEEEEGEELAFPWTNILSQTPNLKVLHAQLQSSAQVSSLLESLLEVGDGPLPIEEFSSFLVDFDAAQVNHLAILNLPLRVLDLSLASSVKESVVEDFLKSACNLENLKLFHETESESPGTLTLPYLPKLRSLELMGSPSAVPGIFAQLPKSCPRLEHLNLSQVVFGKEENKTLKSLGNNVIHNSLLSLSIEEGYLSFEDLTGLGTIFPQLRRVCLFLNDQNIGSLFDPRVYGNLEEVMVLGTELTDAGLIGQTKTTTGTRRMGIADCAKLRKFSLYPQPQDKITDQSIHQGLIHVTSLMIVELPETAVTNEGIKALRNAKPNLLRLSAKVSIVPSGEHVMRSTKYQIL